MEYAYSSYLWPSFVSTALVAALAWYGWRHRRIPAALPFTIGCFFGVAWSVGSMLETAAIDPSTKVFWLKFVTVWQLPMVTAATCFLLQYAGMGRWLSRRTVTLLAVPPLLAAALILTSGLHEAAWTGFTFADGSLQPALGPGLRAVLAYSYLLFLFNIGVLAWLFVRSPRHRWPAALMVFGQSGARFFFEVGVLDWRLPTRWDPDPFVLVSVFGLYAIALFRFHVLDPVPLARAAALDQMQDGMVVVDVHGRIVHANPSAQRALHGDDVDLRGRPAHELMPLDALVAGDGGGSSGGGGGYGDGGGMSELALGSGTDARHYLLETTDLRDRRGFELGRLLLLHDVTEQKRAQALLLEQERAVATLQERERLARELHDSVGQVLGYLSMQAQTVRKRLRDGEGEKADALLARLTDVAQHAHTDVRESILALKAASSEGWSFLPTLGRYLEDFRAQYGVPTELVVAAGVSEKTFTPQAGVQLLRVIQEALTNARRHAGPCRICICMDREDGQARIRVTDDGCGFDASDLERNDGDHFGLAFMRERMAQIDGSVTIDSQRGAGTSVNLAVPVGEGRHLPVGEGHDVPVGEGRDVPVGEGREEQR